MGLDIGYTLYKKEPLNKENKLVDSDIDTEWLCGRNDLNYSFGEYFKDTEHEATIPVFQKELDGKVLDEDGYKHIYKYVSWDDFVDPINREIKELEDNLQEAKTNNLKRQLWLKSEISELRGLQKDCTEDNSYAFDRWEDQIREYKEELADREDWYRSGYKDDYDYSNIQYMKKLLAGMKKRIDENEYYVIPYFSY